MSEDDSEVTTGRAAPHTGARISEDVAAFANLTGEFYRGEVDRACLLVHPNRWAGSYAELVAERTKDAATNVVKYGLQLRP
jgi:hypothetical protein